MNPDWFEVFMAWLKSTVPRPIKWLQNLIGDGDQRMHAFVTLLICLTLCMSTLALVAAILVGVIQRVRYPVLAVPNLSIELGACLSAIGLFGSYIYKQGKMAENAGVKS